AAAAWDRGGVTVRSDRRYTFDADREVVWAALTRVDEYRSWWPWLRRFDGTSFTVGERWRCAVKSPLPYTMRFEIHLTEVIDGERAGAELTGDLDGWAELDLTDDGDGCRLRLVSDLAASR